MARTIINLTLPLITEEIENVLDTCPYYPYHQAFAIPDLRQRLIVYVLNQIRSLYTVKIEDAEQQRLQSASSSEQQLHIKALIHQGIHQILQENTEWIYHHIPQETYSGFEPSHWFG
jgi:hypothetical protein